MPPVKWTCSKSLNFWRTRRKRLIACISQYRTINSERISREHRRLEQQREKREAFFNRHRDRFTEDSPSILYTEESEDVKFWIKHLSWSMCKRCKCLVRKKMLQNYRARSPMKDETKCRCMSSKYYIPLLSKVPDALKNLTQEEIVALRPLEIHTGRYVQRQHGYRVRSSPFVVTWSTLSVEQKIAALQDINKRTRATAGFTTLMSKADSSYSKFVVMRRRAVRAPYTFEIYSNPIFIGIECALWPHLYHCTSMCESQLSGKQNRLSSKESFMVKVRSSVADFSCTYELLHYQYDRWLFKTITGAINTAKFSRCSPATALQEKTFSVEFWRWQHRALIDAVRQYGYPSFFVTISPFEWTFPFPPWLEDLRIVTAKGPTQLPIPETLHIAHVLEQIVRGFLCGTNTKRWRSHLFKNKENPKESNVKTMFYRLEFQKRGTAHIHMLVWLNEITEIRAELINASIPWSNSADAFTVTDLQTSDSTVLSVENHPTFFKETAHGTTLSLQYSPEDFASNIRAYITTLLGALQCRIDVQCTDGKGMILSYVSSYVSKCHDSAKTEALHSTDVGAFQVAQSFLRTMQPLEPEMILQLSDTKIAWSSSRTKHVNAPTPRTAEMHKEYQKYLRRPDETRNLSFLEWLRQYDAKPNVPRPYKEGSTLVAMRYLSVFNTEFFFQYLAINHPHTNTEEIIHDRKDELPKSICFFAKAVELCPDFCRNEGVIRSYFHAEGHKSHFIDTVVFFIRSLNDLLRLWEIKVINRSLGDGLTDVTEDLYPLSPQQDAILQTILSGIDEREHELYGNSSNHHHETNVSPWKKFYLIVGKPGTGKSQVLKRLIHHCNTHEQKVVVATPLAILAIGYSTLFGDNITSDTIHSLFKIPVSKNQCYSVNHALNSFDILVIDEASMISRVMFNLIPNTLNKLVRRPFVVIAGDERQQQPIFSEGTKIRQTHTILVDDILKQQSVRFALFTQFRCQDPKYADFLDYVRYSRPSQDVLDAFQRDKVLITNPPPNERELWNIASEHPRHTILTVSRDAAAKVNHTVLNNAFENQQPLTTFYCDSETTSFPVYKGMQVLITKNRDKAAGVVNGQQATIVSGERDTILLQLTNKKIVFTHPVTETNANGERRIVYPFTPSYALTVCKSQGATINKLLLWMDSSFVPAGTGYVALSRIRKAQDITFITAMKSNQLLPVDFQQYY